MELNLNLPKQRKYILPSPIWKRMLAFAVDLLVIDLIIGTNFRIILYKIFPANISYNQALMTLSENTKNMDILVAATIMGTVLTLMYFIILEWKIQQTLGKILLNISIKSENKELTIWQVILSNLTFIPFFPFVFLWILDPIYMYLSPKSQRFMEKLSKITVVEEQAV